MEEMKINEHSRSQLLETWLLWPLFPPRDIILGNPNLEGYPGNKYKRDCFVCRSVQPGLSPGVFLSRFLNRELGFLLFLFLNRVLLLLLLYLILVLLTAFISHCVSPC